MILNHMTNYENRYRLQTNFSTTYTLQRRWIILVRIRNQEAKWNGYKHRVHILFPDTDPEDKELHGPNQNNIKASQTKILLKP